MMAQNLEGIKEITAGNIVAIGDLDDLVFKTATVSSLATCPSFTPIQIGVNHQSYYSLIVLIYFKNHDYARKLWRSSETSLRTKKIK